MLDAGIDVGHMLPSPGAAHDACAETLGAADFTPWAEGPVDTMTAQAERSEAEASAVATEAVGLATVAPSACISDLKSPEKRDVTMTAQAERSESEHSEDYDPFARNQSRSPPLECWQRRKSSRTRARTAQVRGRGMLALGSAGSTGIAKGERAENLRRKKFRETDP